MEKSTSATTDIFQKFDIAIKNKLHSIDRGYVGDKPNPEDWADLIESEKDFRDEFYRIFNDVNVEEADAHILEVLEDTYLNMELVLPRDGEGPEFARVTKRLRDANGIPIGTANNNPILDSSIYEVDYADGYKASLTANAISENLFAQVDDEGHRFVQLSTIEQQGTKSKAMIHLSSP